MKFFALGVVLSLLARVTNGGVSMHDPFYCYSTDPIRSMTAATGYITSYEATRRFNFTTVNPYTPSKVFLQVEKSDNKLYYLAGAPSRFWYLGRYAAHFPHVSYFPAMLNFAESSVQEDVVSNYEAGRTTLCRPDFEAIRDFNKDTEFEIEFALENAWMVTESGVIAMQNIARRLQQRYPNILSQNYSSDRFHFRHSSLERTNASIRAFASGLFGDAGSQNVIYEDIPAVDWFLRPYEFCPAFTEEIADWAAVRTAFQEGPEFEEMMEQVNRKLGFLTSNQLSFNEIYTMWNWCRFRIAGSFETSNSEIGGNATWCAAFSVAHHHLLQYYIDLGLFYQSGYGVRNQRMLENLNCGLFQDLLTHMESNNNQTARIFVTNAHELLIMLVSLGSFRDVWPPHQHNFAQQSDRRWSTNMIVQFSANIVVVRYDSDDGDHDLIFLLNEKPMLVPGCDQQNGVCKLSLLRTRFQRFINANCPVSFCSND